MSAPNTTRIRAIGIRGSRVSVRLEPTFGIRMVVTPWNRSRAPEFLAEGSSKLRFEPELAAARIAWEHEIEG